MHTLNEYGEIKVDHYPFLTSTLDGGVRSVSGPGQHTPRERTRVKGKYFVVHAIKLLGPELFFLISVHPVYKM